MATPGQGIIGSTGKFGILSTGKLAMFNASSACPECCGGFCICSLYFTGTSAMVIASCSAVGRGAYLPLTLTFNGDQDYFENGVIVHAPPATGSGIGSAGATQKQLCSAVTSFDYGVDSPHWIYGGGVEPCITDNIIPCQAYWIPNQSDLEPPLRADDPDPTITPKGSITSGKLYDQDGVVINPADPMPVLLVGDSFSYQITASAQAGCTISSYYAKNLPDGITINTTTGLISGTATTPVLPVVCEIGAYYDCSPDTTVYAAIGYLVFTVNTVGDPASDDPRNVVVTAASLSGGPLCIEFGPLPTFCSGDNIPAGLHWVDQSAGIWDYDDPNNKPKGTWTYDYSGELPPKWPLREIWTCI